MSDILPLSLKIRLDDRCNCKQSSTPRNPPSEAMLSEARVEPKM